METSPHIKLKTSKEVLSLYIGHVIELRRRKERGLGLNAEVNLDYDNAHLHLDQLLDDYSDALTEIATQDTIAFEPVESD